MELRDWEVIVAVGDLETPGAGAEVEVVEGRKLARIVVDENFRGKAPDVQRYIVVHELVHCHLTPVQHQVEYDLEKELGRQADRLFSDGFRRNLEYGVDGLASAIAKHLPLIEWP